MAELGDGLMLRSKVLLNVFNVVGVTADRLSIRFPVALADEPYDVESDVCNDNLGRLVGGIDRGLSEKIAGWRGKVAEGGTWLNCMGFIGQVSMIVFLWSRS